MSRRFPEERNLQRRGAQLEPPLRIVVFCEGKTEPDYLSNFAADYRNGLVKVEPVAGVGVPRTIVKLAVERKKELAREHKRNSFERFEVWGLFDVDEHPGIPEARIEARDNGIELAVSNPCFELWGVFHLGDHDAHIERHPLQQKLSKLMKGYHHDSNPYFNYTLMRERYDAARTRARKGIERRKEEGKPAGNPSTDVYRLLDLIIENGKPISSRLPSVEHGTTMTPGDDVGQRKRSPKRGY